MAHHDEKCRIRKLPVRPHSVYAYNSMLTATRFLVVLLEPACRISAEVYARTLITHLSPIPNRIRAVIVIKNWNNQSGTACVVFSPTPRYNNALGSDLSDILDEYQQLDVRFCLPDSISDGAPPAFDLAPCFPTIPLQLQWVRLSLHEIPATIINHNLSASITTALGLLASSHELWTCDAIQDPTAFQTTRTMHKTHFPIMRRRRDGPEYLPPTVQITAASMEAAEICIQAVSPDLQHTSHAKQLTPSSLARRRPKRMPQHRHHRLQTQTIPHRLSPFLKSPPRPLPPPRRDLRARLPGDQQRPCWRDTGAEFKAEGGGVLGSGDV